MIKFISELNLFHLTNKKISYYILLNDEGYLEKIYFGKYKKNISKDELFSLRKHYVNNGSTCYFDQKEEVEKEYSDKYDSFGALKEIGSFGKDDKRGAPLIIYKDNSFSITSFKYESYKIYKGIMEYQNVPCVRNLDNKNIDTLSITLKEENSSTKLIYNISIVNDEDIIIKNFIVKNVCKNPIYLKRAASLELDLDKRDYSLIHFTGHWANERYYEEIPFHDGTTKIYSNTGRSSHEDNPFVYIKDKKANEIKGEVIGFNLIYSGNFMFEMNLNYLNSPRIIYGINDEDFLYKLNENEEFVTPQAIISYSSKGTDYMSQTFHRFIKKYIITYPYEHDYKPILFNSWEGCTFDFDTNLIVNYAKEAKKIGSELFVLDDGWFGHRDSDTEALGDWFVNTSKIDLKKVIDEVHSLGMKFGLWFEPEMINSKSNLYQEHKEYVLGPSNVDVSISRHQLVLDFSNDEVVENIYNQMVLILDRYAIDYIKWDHNRIIGEHYSKKYKNDEQGMIYHKYVLGFYKLLTLIRKRYPNIMIEGCASGGGRFDLGSLYYTPQIWASDESNPLVRYYIQYNTSIGYPLSTIGSHANNNALASYLTKAQLALFGTYGYEMNPLKLTNKDKEELNRVAAIYKKYHSDVIENGTLYHLISPTKSNNMSMMCVDSSKNNALVILMNIKEEKKTNLKLKLRGLDKNAYYLNDYDNKEYLGSFYMKQGLVFNNIIRKENSSLLIILNRRIK